MENWKRAAIAGIGGSGGFVAAEGETPAAVLVEAWG